MDAQLQSEVRTAAYLATQQRLDLRRGGPAPKTRRGKLNCTPGNKQCGARCQPQAWACRIKGEGQDNHTTATRNDPLAGIASIQRGAKDVARGVVTVNPARVERGRNSLIRGVVKLAPGDSIQQKKELQRKLKQASTPVAAVIGLTLVGLGAHAGLKRGFAGYRNGLGADVDRAAARAVDSVLDRLPGTAGPRAARRAAGAAAASEIASSALRGSAIQRTQQATAGNLRRVGPLSFRPNAANYEASGLVDQLNAINARARSGNRSYDEWQRDSVQALYGATSVGSRGGGRRGSVFSEHAANEFLVSRFRLPGAGAVGARGAESISVRNGLVEQQLAQRLSSWGQAIRDDMRVRRFGTGPAEVDRYLRTVGGGAAQRFAGLPAGRRNEMNAEYNRMMRVVIGGDQQGMLREARSMRRALVSQYDTYFEGVAVGMRRNAVAADSPFGDGLTGLARYVTRRSGQSSQIVSREHADLILRNHYHTRVMDLKNDFLVSENTARRVAQQLTRSPQLPDADSAYRILNNSGFPSASRSAQRVGQATPPRVTLAERINRLMERAQRQGRTMSRAAAERQARAEIERARLRRRDAAEDGLIRAAAYLATRADLRETPRQGKPCGESHIPKAHECRKGKGAAAPAESSRGRTVAAAVAITAGAGLTVAGLMAYRNRATLVPGLSQDAIRKLSTDQVKAGLDKLPEQFREPARKLVGDAKRGAAHMALRAQGAKIKAVDVENNFSTWVTANGTHLSVGSVGDSLLTFGAERKGNVGKFPQYGLGFTVNSSYDAAGGMPASQAKQLIRTTKAMYKAQMDMLPDDAFLFAVPHKADGKGAKRKSIYEGFGFKAIPGLKGDKLWALKNQGKFTEIPEAQFDYLRGMIRGDAADEETIKAAA